MALGRDEALKDQKIGNDTDSMADKGLEAKESTGEESPATENINPSEELTLEEELAKVKAKAEEQYNQLIRLQAEYDNYRKRTLKEKTEIIKYATEGLMGELLPILDNFDRAISAAKVTSDFASFSQGVEMIFRQIETALGKEGLKAIDAVGQPFDPNIHEAVLQVATDEHPENTIIEELQKGYYLKDKVLRPSMVKVSKLVD
ncbi:MAG: nucleotide exchange factor GrpE [Desulfosporosinus sp.]|jgi:molecular chaperone GrpE